MTRPGAFLAVTRFGPGPCLSYVPPPRHSENPKRCPHLSPRDSEERRPRPAGALVHPSLSCSRGRTTQRPRAFQQPHGAPLWRTQLQLLFSHFRSTTVLKSSGLTSDSSPEISRKITFRAKTRRDARGCCPWVMLCQSSEPGIAGHVCQSPCSH